MKVAQLRGEVQSVPASTSGWSNALAMGACPPRSPVGCTTGPTPRVYSRECALPLATTCANVATGTGARIGSCSACPLDRWQRSAPLTPQRAPGAARTSVTPPDLQPSPPPIPSSSQTSNSDKLSRPKTDKKDARPSGRPRGASWHTLIAHAACPLSGRRPAHGLMQRGGSANSDLHSRGELRARGNDGTPRALSARTAARASMIIHVHEIQTMRLAQLIMETWEKRALDAKKASSEHRALLDHLSGRGGDG